MSGVQLKGFAHNLKHDELIDDLKSVIRELDVRRNCKSLIFETTLLLSGCCRIRSGTEEIKGIVLTLIDVGSLHQAQADLEQFKFMVEAATDGMIVADREGSNLLRKSSDV